MTPRLSHILARVTDGHTAAFQMGMVTHVESGIDARRMDSDGMAVLFLGTPGFADAGNRALRPKRVSNPFRVSSPSRSQA
jgi:hypothetical protein